MQIASRSICSTQELLKKGGNEPDKSLPSVAPMAAEPIAHFDKYTMCYCW